VSSSRIEQLGTARRVLASRDGDLAAAMESAAFRADMCRALGVEVQRLYDGVAAALDAIDDADPGGAAEILRQLIDHDTEAHGE